MSNTSVFSHYERALTNSAPLRQNEEIRRYANVLSKSYEKLTNVMHEVMHDCAMIVNQAKMLAKDTERPTDEKEYGIKDKRAQIVFLAPWYEETLAKLIEVANAEMLMQEPFLRTASTNMWETRALNRNLGKGRRHKLSFKNESDTDSEMDAEMKNFWKLPETNSPTPKKPPTPKRQTLV